MEKTNSNESSIIIADNLGINPTQPSVLKQIANYSFQGTESSILKYKTLLSKQQILHHTLKSADSAEFINEINNFVDTRQSSVENQLKTLNELKQNLCTICEENSYLEKQDDKLEQLQKTPNVVHLANQLATINNLQKEIDDFLVQQGVTTSPQV